MGRLPLTYVLLACGLPVYIDDADFESVSAHDWYLGVGRYAQTRIDGRQVYMHRYLLSPPPGMVIDHVDGDGLNNCRDNIRVCTQGENLRNNKTRKDNRLGIKGVCEVKPGRFRAKITVAGNHYFLGLHPTAELAQQAYAEGAALHHGEYARLA